MRRKTKKLEINKILDSDSMINLIKNTLCRIIKYCFNSQLAQSHVYNMNYIEIATVYNGVYLLQSCSNDLQGRNLHKNLQWNFLNQRSEKEKFCLYFCSLVLEGESYVGFSLENFFIILKGHNFLNSLSFLLIYLHIIHKYIYLIYLSMDLR